MPFCGEGSHNVKFVDNFAEVCGGELASPICVEQDTIGYASQPDGVAQGIDGV